MAQHSNSAFTPLIELLEDELHAVGLSSPNDQQVTDSKGFAQWFLATIQVLERYVASSNANPPMSRNEVELLCRCALTASTLAQAFELIENFTAMLYPRAGKSQYRAAPAAYGYHWTRCAPSAPWPAAWWISPVCSPLNNYSTG